MKDLLKHLGPADFITIILFIAFLVWYLLNRFPETAVGV